GIGRKRLLNILQDRAGELGVRRAACGVRRAACAGVGESFRAGKQLVVAPIPANSYPCRQIGGWRAEHKQ
ncbi:MAG TPA: hypothetical protein PKZ97_16140, partial [Azospirillaceae bacterium]|nr:hypothetical protein [Azospirillaceae bacterium]